ncbi:unnamed protein product, partial [Prorocentrum cordatum]
GGHYSGMKVTGCAPTPSPTPNPTPSPAHSPAPYPTPSPPTLSPTTSPTLSPTLSPTTPSPTPSPPTLSPTTSPTPSPTLSPTTPSPTPTGAAVAATGDPHLQNIFGQRFDLMRAGRHVLIQIPRGAGSEGTLLRVEAEAQSLGTHCSEMYSQEVNPTGKWVARKHLGGLQFRAADDVTETPKWLRFGSVDLKLVHGRALTGVRFLNLYVKRLGSTGISVGGLLGMDDHSQESTPSTRCIRELNLVMSPSLPNSL